MKKFLGILALALFVCLPLSVSAKINFANGMKCTEPEKNSEGKDFVTCTFSAETTANETISSITIDLTFNEPSNIVLDESSVKGSGAFTAAVLENTISFTANEPQSGETIEFGQFTYYINDIAKDCGFVYTPTGSNIDAPQQTVTVKPVENPKTGSAVSYIAVGAGILLVAGAFVLSRKNTKMYKI